MTTATVLSILAGLLPQIAHTCDAVEALLPPGAGTQKLDTAKAIIATAAELAGDLEHPIAELMPAIENVIHLVVGIANDTGIYAHAGQPAKTA